MIFRLYSPDDFDQLYALEERCFEPPHRFERRYMRLLVRRANAATWIADEDGTIKGFAIVEWRKLNSGITAYIQTIEVAPEARGVGVGRELLGRVEGSARAADATVIWLHAEAENAGAIRLYEAEGYQCQGRQENYYPQNRAALIYLKRLTSC
jgi:ribosomal protein S18 acetylase RimI-like enzyme